MISQKEFEEIENYLIKSENPLFFFDDDPDGLCSYLLLRKRYGKGKGIPVKTSHDMYDIYLRKIKEYSPDVVFILDKPVLSQDVVDKINVPLIWIDHHEPLDLKGLKIFNPRVRDKKDSRPVSYWCYKIVRESMWIGMVGAVGDWFLPEFTKEFCRQYPDLLNKDVKDPGEALYENEFGKLSKIFSFALKGNTSDVRKNINILVNIDTPYEILRQESARGKYIYTQFLKINKQYEALLEKAIKSKTKSKFLIFTYPSGKMSFTGDLSNELLYKFPNKIIIIAREKNESMRLSLRSKNVILPPILLKALDGVEGYGGGHEYACGANIAKKDFDRFTDKLKEYIK